MRLFLGRIIFLIAVCLTFTGGFLSGYIICAFQSGGYKEILSDKNIVAWVGVGVNLAVVFVALFMNILREHLKKPRFRISCGQEPPWQISKVMSEKNSNKKRLYIRLRVENSGLIAAEACEVRLEKIEVVKYEDGKKVYRPLIHDPRPLKWIGRDCSPIQLSPGSFDFVDLGAQNENYQENLRIEFHERGHLDLNLIKDEAVEYILKGNVYSKGAFPQKFTFCITWDADDESSVVKISEEK